LCSLSGFLQNEKEGIPSLEGKNVLNVYGGWEGHQAAESVVFMVHK